jgi:hypothetical protein
MIILALLLHPEAQNIAYSEIAALHRSVTLDDRPSLPYIDCIIREALRWNPILPLGLARCSVKDDMYRGYLIPKGTVILPNIWFVSEIQRGFIKILKSHRAAIKDESITDVEFPENEFIPERFLQSEIIDDPYEYSFGFGRRYLMIFKILTMSHSC